MMNRLGGRAPALNGATTTLAPGFGGSVGGGPSSVLATRSGAISAQGTGTQGTGTQGAGTQPQQVTVLVEAPGALSTEARQRTGAFPIAFPPVPGDRRTLVLSSPGPGSFITLDLRVTWPGGLMREYSMLQLPGDQTSRVYVSGPDAVPVIESKPGPVLDGDAGGDAGGYVPDVYRGEGKPAPWYRTGTGQVLLGLGVGALGYGAWRWLQSPQGARATQDLIDGYNARLDRMMGGPKKRARAEAEAGDWTPRYIE